MTRTILDIHVLQTVPPSNLNRDDTGSPKTAFYGGVRRSRVSSQAWKRATRVAFRELVDPSQFGVRTKQIPDVLAERIRAIEPSLDEPAAVELATATLKQAGIAVKVSSKGKAEAGYLVFLSARQLDNLAAAAIDAFGSGQDLTTALKEHNPKKVIDRDHSIDIALFGRMVADIADVNVDAAVQVAHAISVHPVDNEYDYYTAVDDRRHANEETGAGMIGTVEFNSATLYRYATLDVDRLHENLGKGEATSKAAEVFVQTFVTSMPTGKQNTFANRTLPDLVIVKLRETQPISFVGAFEEPVRETDSAGRVRRATEALASYVNEVENGFGEPAIRTWVVRVGDRASGAAPLGEASTFPELVTAVGETVAARLEG